MCKPDLTQAVVLCFSGVVECIHASGGEPGETLSLEFIHWLRAACDTLGECANGFTKLGCREQAAETHAERANGLRSVSCSTRPEFNRGVVQMGVPLLYFVSRSGVFNLF